MRRPTGGHLPRAAEAEPHRQTGDELLVLEGHAYQVNDVAFAPEGYFPEPVTTLTTYDVSGVEFA